MSKKDCYVDKMRIAILIMKMSLVEMKILLICEFIQKYVQLVTNEKEVVFLISSFLIEFGFFK